MNQLAKHTVKTCSHHTKSTNDTEIDFQWSSYEYLWPFQKLNKFWFSKPSETCVRLLAKENWLLNRGKIKTNI